MCVFPPKGKKTAEERKKGKDNYCRERERERESPQNTQTSSTTPPPPPPKPSSGGPFFDARAVKRFFFRER